MLTHGFKFLPSKMIKKKKGGEATLSPSFYKREAIVVSKNKTIFFFKGESFK